MIKLANPFYYPIAVLAGGIVLVVGARFLKLPTVIIVPAAAIVSTSIASFQPDEEALAQQKLALELSPIKSAATNLAHQAEVLRQEAQQLLSKDSWQLDLLVAIQQACDCTLELPLKIDQLAERLPQKQALLSVEELLLQLEEVNQKCKTSSGITRDHLEKLAESLTRNIHLAQTGQDSRQAQILNLEMLIQESGGFLQALQNRLRTSDLNNFEDLQSLRQLSHQLNTVQENVDLLMS